MDIKVGDIVEYQERQYRVLNHVNKCQKRLHLFSSFDSVWVRQLPPTKVGDLSLI